MTAAKEAGVGKRKDDRKEEREEPLWQLHPAVCLQLAEEYGAEELGTKRAESM